MWNHNKGSIAFVPLAEILRTEGFLEEAQQVCERGLEFNPESVSGRLILASVYWDQNKKSDAERIANQILDRMPGHAEALKYVARQRSRPVLPQKLLWQTSTMAEILADQGEYREAVGILDRLVKRDPKNKDLKLRLNELEEMVSGEEKTIA